MHTSKSSHLKLFIIACLFLLGGCRTAAPLRSAISQDAALLEGWENCLLSCGRDFISAYSALEFVRLDDTLLRSPTVSAAPGRHWLEARYSWGFGILVGAGNYRNYGCELDLRAGHRYRIQAVPSGCIAPWSESSLRPVTLQIEDYAGDDKPVVTPVAALEYCYPPVAMDHTGSGSCRNDADCKNGVCTRFAGTTGYGLCGKLR